MRNLIVNNPTKYQITYKDSKNQKSTRRVVVIDQNQKSFTAYCYKSHGIRTFNKRNVLAITSVE